MTRWRGSWLSFALKALLLMGLVPAGWAAWAPMSSNSRDLVYIIPKGTWARRVAGEKLEVLPSNVRLTLGVQDVLVLKNHDDVPQLFGLVLLMPGQTFRLPFRRAAKYQFACALHTTGQLNIVVEPVPEAGWARLRWRVARLTEHRRDPVNGERGEAIL